ncbi:hypothetical protein BDAP_001936 [Binucleata daphniae]
MIDYDASMYTFYKDTLKNIDDHVVTTLYKNLKDSNEMYCHLLSEKSSENDKYNESCIEDRSLYTIADSSTETNAKPLLTKNYRLKDNSKKETAYEIFIKYTKCKKIKEEQIRLLENLRFVILKNIKTSKNREKLLYYHSVVHLVLLTLKTEIPYHKKLNEWLDVNYNSDDIVTNVMRGNFDKVVDVYPELKNVFEELMTCKTDCKSTIECNEIDHSLATEDQTKNTINFYSMCNEKQDENNLIVTYKNNNHTFLHYKLQTMLCVVQKIWLYFICTVQQFWLYFILCLTQAMQNEDDHTNEDFVKKWYNKHSKKMPKIIKSVCKSNFCDKTKHWGDVLCHELLFVYRKNGSFVTTKEEINEILLDENIYALVLKEDWNAAMQVADDWLKLVLIFITDVEHEMRSLSFIFEQNAKHIYKIDYLLSLKYFAYTKNVNLYYNFTINNIKFTFISVYFLYDFAVSNKLEHNKILDLFCKEMFEKKNYHAIFSIMNQYDYIYKIENQNQDFITFCIENYKHVRQILKTRVTNYDVYKFIRLMIKISKKKEMNKEELTFLLNSIYNENYIKEIVSEYLKLELKENDLHFLLGKVIQKKALVPTAYKKMILERFDNLCEK